MKLLHSLVLSLWWCCPAGAQIVFSATDLPHQFGEYYRAYYTTSAVDVSSLLGQPGGPRRWDFSYAMTPVESIQRMDVAQTTDGGQGASFPDAVYAERLTNEMSAARSWSYYRIATNQGRVYYGFYDAVANPTCPLKVFDAPTIDLPDGIHFSQTWSRTVDFSDCIDAGFIVIDLAVHFISQAEVDAYGTVVLAGIGEVPALRVNEVNTYEVTDLTLGIFDSTTYFRNYYWLVRGIGKAVHIISEPSSTGPPPPNFTTAKTVLRVFEASRRPVADLRIRRQGGEVVLDWLAQTNNSGYRVESSADLSTMNWQVSAEPMTNSWSEVVMPGVSQRFFRVFLKP